MSAKNITMGPGVVSLIQRGVGVCAGLVLGAVLLSASGCGGLAADIAEQIERERHTQRFVFDDSADALWKELGIVTLEGGCQLPVEPKVDETVRCEGGRDDFGDRLWKHVRLTTVEGGYMLEIIDMSESQQENGKWVPNEGYRAHELEWALISRMHPTEAAKIASEAKAERPEGKAASKEIQGLVRELWQAEREAEQ